MTPEKLQETAADLREIVRAVPSDKELNKADTHQLLISVFTGINIVTLALALLFEHLAKPTNQKTP